MAGENGMAQCPYLERCNYFSNQLESFQVASAAYRKWQIDKLRSLMANYQMQYCTHNCLQCARYMVGEAIGFDKVPDSLHPEHVLQAKEIIQKHRAATVGKPG